MITSILDPYDDDFASLPRIFEERRREKPDLTVPQFIKEAEMLTQQELAALPDHVFAVIGLSPGRPAMRKYACVDGAHTAVNTMYFLDVKKHMPYEMREKAAENLVAACQRFNIAPPEPLLKAASGKRVLIKGDVPLTTKLKKDQGEKRADVSGTSLMPRTVPGEKRKCASFMDSPYVEINPYEDLTEEKAVDPVDPLGTPRQIKFASSHFDHNWRIMHPRARREYCTKLAEASTRLRVPISRLAEKYGSATYAADNEFNIATTLRCQELGEESVAAGVLKSLITKKAELDPQAFAEALADFDVTTGLDSYWDRAVPDPWSSTFGVIKQASWRWEGSGEKIDEKQLRDLAINNRQKVASMFGSHLANGLAESPVDIFNSLPLDQKQVIARMANQ